MFCRGVARGRATAPKMRTRRREMMQASRLAIFWLATVWIGSVARGETTSAATRATATTAPSTTPRTAGASTQDKKYSRLTVGLTGATSVATQAVPSNDRFTLNAVGPSASVNGTYSTGGTASFTKTNATVTFTVLSASRAPL